MALVMIGKSGGYRQLPLATGQANRPNTYIIITSI